MPTLLRLVYSQISAHETGMGLEGQTSATGLYEHGYYPHEASEMSISSESGRLINRSAVNL